ncbi:MULTISPECIES: PASTA domain-containing protein [unclassified Algibacter]|uniref:PASTA domain-containing protein n=1 Tax=unclassified Algibacter TaxID=2615009 RepID=UPI00131AA88A|nr:MULTISPECIES: PASTA domain-containing protein [unclassified Algibacter]MCL5128889.1 PASTA domain-containing protein [Algibacter sp. L4_22]
MSIIKFLVSKTFFKQLALAIVAIVVLCFIMLKWLNVSTNHGEFETVPDLKGKSINVAEIELSENNLVMQIQDSANFNPNYPKFSVIEQEPISGTQVKENRKIYLTLNPSGYQKIEVPDLKERTYRQARPTLEALGFKVGKLTYENNIAEDMVLRMSYKGKTIKPSDKLPKTSVIDLVLGNGNRP